jgi:hypothetical protein
VDTNLITRVEFLESQLRRWKAIMLVVLIAVTVVVVIAAARPQDDGSIKQVPAPRLSAQVFLLIGQDGKTYGRLYTKDDHPMLEFYDSKGTVIWSAPTTPTSGAVPPNNAPNRSYK